MRRFPLFSRIFYIMAALSPLWLLLALYSGKLVNCGWCFHPAERRDKLKLQSCWTECLCFCASLMSKNYGGCWFLRCQFSLALLHIWITQTPLCPANETRGSRDNSFSQGSLCRTGLSKRLVQPIHFFTLDSPGEMEYFCSSSQCGRTWLWKNIRRTNSLRATSSEPRILNVQLFEMWS